MRHDPKAIREKILAALPEGFVVPEHNERGHWYRINDSVFPEAPLYPSVTAKLQVIKDEGLANWKMNQALNYIFANFKKFNDENIMEHIEAAEKVPAGIFEDAGDIGTIIHNVRERIFTDWIMTGIRPSDFQSYITDDIKDIRAMSAIAALEKFCIEKNYQPIITEKLVFSHRWKIGGTLDDLGLMRVEIRGGSPGCEHDIICSTTTNFDRCVKCEAKWRWTFVLLDLKSSNRFKDAYFFQVAMYYAMLIEQTKLRPQKAFILKVSKEDRTFKLEELKKPAMIARYATNVLRTNEGLDFIKTLRKDNQRRVITI